jgi:ABC-type antimicrobial peptide transport system permease subunit
MRIEEGRTFTEAEAAAGEAVAVISRTAARTIFGGRSPLGEPIRLEGSAEALASMGLTGFRHVRVIGVASDVVAGIVFTGRETNIVWLPTSPSHKNATLVLSVTGDAALALKGIETRLDTLIPGAVNDVHTLDESIAAQIYPLQAASWISGVLGIIALFLTVAGIYGVLAYVVQQRTREIGIRMALGALPRNAALTVVRQSLRLAGAGSVVGLGLALAVSRIFSVQVELVRTFDAFAYFGSLGVALVASLLAAWIPSRRASAVNP